ncbi:hypothetical protein J7E71_12590 [Mesobacillus foraminis]|uniref:hypothetical protein n=1 Tax=Mesobacillus foraminis TaxID=279826 RepID=UPI001BEAA6B3|nr:hypothetical protein [Mesobacillus foraminis]MBT2756793.1 hypothetical protein [Mesobacillus foraminis]
MSYDIGIWSVKKTSFEDEFFKQKNIKWLNTGVVYEGPNWQILVGKPNEILEEDIPEEIFGELPGISYFTEIILEPICAPKRAFQILNKITKILAQSSHGLIEDKQEDTIRTPSGVKRFKNIPVRDEPNIMTMSWWFIDDQKFKKDGFKNFLNLIESMIPEAMPRRYGLSEPPQFKLSDKGKAHFIEFMLKNLHEGVVWYPSKPFKYVHIGISDEIGPTNLGYKSCYIDIEFVEEVMAQPGWALEMRRFWVKASDLLNPFYGEIRSGMSPIQGPWWRGIPKNLGASAILGKPYMELWPDFMKKAKQTPKGLYYIENINEVYQDIHSIVGKVPETIVQPRDEEKYSKIWPFEGPFLK